MTRHAVFVSLLPCLCVGCGGRADPTAPGVDLAPPSAVVTTDPAFFTASVPVGMLITREVPLHSRFETALTRLKAVSSCGCTSAEIDKETIAPNGMATLRCVFDGGVNGSSRNVRIMLFSPDVPSGPFVVDLRFETDPHQSGFQIISSPSRIVVDEPWQSSHVQEYECSLRFGENVPRDAIEISSSAKYISANLRMDSLKIAIDSPAAGPIDEYVTLSFRHSKGTYSLRIPIRGNIRPPIKVSRQFINFGEVPRDKDMADEVLFEGSDKDLERPDIAVTGDWKIHSLERVTERSWRLRVCTKALRGDDFRYGNILVKGKWPGKQINIPLTGKYKKQ